MATRARKKTLSRQQYERRADGRIVRVEVSLNTNKPGDIFISDRLNNLPPGITKSDYLRAALLDKITSERREMDTDQKIAALRTELAEIKAMLIEMATREVTVQMVQAAQVTVGPATPPTLPEMDSLPKEMPSSGLDMSRGRPRAKLARGPVIKQAPDVATEMTDEYRAMLGKMMADSIKNAQPGRNST